MGGKYSAWEAEMLTETSIREGSNLYESVQDKKSQKNVRTHMGKCPILQQ